LGILDGHIDHVLPKDGIHTSRGGFVAADPYELEADHFSAGLLMPSEPFKQALGKRRPGLDSVEFMAGLCRTKQGRPIEKHRIKRVPIL
jgi:hypothetical protein